VKSRNATQLAKSEVLQKVIASINYSPDNWINVVVYKTGSSRLRPIRIDNTIIFLECDIIKDEVGYVDFMTLAYEKEFHIDYFEVHTLYQRQGYGREIYLWIENYAKRKGMHTMYLTPYNSAIRFWIKMGFVPISNESDEMVKSLIPHVPDTQMLWVGR
jgi:GNAT superfamily N-acetyltransferase